MRRVLLLSAAVLAAAVLGVPGAANGPGAPGSGQEAASPATTAPMRAPAQPAGTAAAPGSVERGRGAAAGAPVAQAAGVKGPSGQSATPAPTATPGAGDAPEGHGDAAGAACAERVIDRVQSHYESVRDLEARFEQTTHPVAFGTGGTSEPFVARGTVVFAKPGRMRWVYEAPEPSLVVSDGETVWVVDPVAREAQHLPLGERFLSGAAIQFLLGEGDLRREFHVRAQSCSDERARLVLRPREDAPFERLEIEVDPASGVVRETTVVDLLGNRTTVRLENVRTNRSPDASLFRYVPEEGVRVLELPPAR